MAGRPRAVGSDLDDSDMQGSWAQSAESARAPWRRTLDSQLGSGAGSRGRRWKTSPGCRGFGAPGREIEDVRPCWDGIR